MRVGIISDTHDRLNRTVRAVEALKAEGAEAILHCGDFTTPEIIHVCGLLPSYYVFGNNDYDETRLRAAMEAVGGTCLGRSGEITLAGRRIAMTHGDNGRLFFDLLAKEPDYLLFGHSHEPMDHREGKTRQINPGALHRATEYRVALLDLATDRLEAIMIAP